MSGIKPANSRCIPGKTMFLGLLIITVVAGTQAAASEANPAGADPAASIPVFEVAPVQRAGAILAPNAQTPVAPAPLADDQKAQILEGLRTDDSSQQHDPDAQVNINSITLSPKNPYMEGQGLLTVTLAASVHPETAIKFEPKNAGSAGVKIKVEKGQKYLLDFFVRSLGSGSYQVETENGKQEFVDEAGQRTHVLIALSASSSGWTTVRLRREGTGYYLYAVEITTIN